MGKVKEKLQELSEIIQAQLDSGTDLEDLDSYMELELSLPDYAFYLENKDTILNFFEGLKTKGKMLAEANFQRGLDPKDAMNTGQKYIDQQFIDSVNWDSYYGAGKLMYDIVELIKNYKNYPILIVKNSTFENMDDDDVKKRLYTAFSKSSPRSTRAGYYATPKEALIAIKYNIDHLKESHNFKRNIDPRAAMDIGEPKCLICKNVLKYPLSGSVCRPCADREWEKQMCLNDLYAQYKTRERNIDLVNTLYEKYPKVDIEWIKKIVFNPKLDDRDNLAETQHFQRGLDPKQAMDIGIKKVIQNKFQKLFNINQEEGGEIRILNIVLNRWCVEILTDQNPDETLAGLYDQRRRNDVSSYLKDLFKNLNIEEYIQLPGSTLNTYKFKKEFFGLFSEEGITISSITETQHFQRGLDPKDAMGTGGIKKRKEERITKKIKAKAAELKTKCEKKEDIGLYLEDDLQTNYQMYRDSKVGQMHVDRLATVMMERHPKENSEHIVDYVYGWCDVNIDESFYPRINESGYNEDDEDFEDENDYEEEEEEDFEELVPSAPKDAPHKYWNGEGDYQREYDKYWKELVPNSGPAESLQGELLRNLGRIMHDRYNNGFGNDREEEAVFLKDHADKFTPYLKNPDAFRIFYAQYQNIKFGNGRAVEQNWIGDAFFDGLMDAILKYIMNSEKLETYTK